jgi:predicted component of type VI protein secretion system
LRFEIDLGSATSKSGRLQAHEPMDTLVIADCSGRRARGLTAPLSGRRPRSISVDNLDAVFAAWRAEIVVQLDGLTVSLSPRSLEDLHPDQLLCNVTPVSSPPQPNVTAGSGETADLLERLLGASAGGAAARPVSAASADGVQRVVGELIRGAVGDAALSQGPSGEQQARNSAAELELGRRLRALLHSAPFRALESTWRAIDSVCRNCPDEELVRFQVMDASLAELLDDLDGLTALLEAQRPSLVVVDDYIDASAEALGALQPLLRACAAQRAILAIGASPALASYPSFEASAVPPEEVTPPASALDAWKELARTRAEGAQLALVLPRYLLRQPYGRLGEPLDRLEFEEVLAGDHEAFLWGNGAYLAARALAERHAGGGSQLDGSVELGDLPIVRLPDDDGYRLQPSAEAWLPERAVERLRAAGFTVLQGVRDSDRLRVHI